MKSKKEQKSWAALIKTDRRRVDGFDAFQAALWQVCNWESEALVIDYVRRHYANGRQQGYPPIGR